MKYYDSNMVWLKLSKSWHNAQYRLQHVMLSHVVPYVATCHVVSCGMFNCHVVLCCVLNQLRWKHILLRCCNSQLTLHVWNLGYNRCFMGTRAPCKNVGENGDSGLVHKTTPCEMQGVQITYSPTHVQLLPTQITHCGLIKQIIRPP